MATRLFARTVFNTRSLLLASKNYTCRTNVVYKTMLPSLTSVLPQQARAFTLTSPRFGCGEADSELVHQLEEEMKFEEADVKNEVPAFVQEFLDNKLFEIKDVVGHDKVTLTRNFGNEKITVVFSISDINNTVEEFTEEEEEEELEKDVIEDKEEAEKESKNIEQKKEDDDEDELESFPVRATVLVEKEGKGSLVLHTVAQDGYLHIDAVRYFKEGEVATDDITTHDIGEQRQDLYMGPVFEELDEDLQTTFTKYLEERGIDTALANFLPDYVDYKEQKEYVNWLKDVNEFISA